MPKDRYTPVLTGDQVNQAVRTNWFIMLGFIPYLAAASGVIGLFDAPVSRLFGVTSGDLPIVLDFTVLIVIPLGLILWRKLHFDRRAGRILRQNFLTAYADERLVVNRYVPNKVFKVTGGDSASGRIEVVPIWSADRPVADAEAYVSDISAFEPFVPGRFLGG